MPVVRMIPPGGTKPLTVTVQKDGTVLERLRAGWSLPDVESSGEGVSEFWADRLKNARRLRRLAEEAGVLYAPELAPSGAERDFTAMRELAAEIGASASAMLAAAGTLSRASDSGGGGTGSPLPRVWRLSPNSYTDPDGLETSSAEPIQDVIGANAWSSSGRNRPRKCARGDRLELSPGSYKHFRITYDEPADEARAAPIVIAGATEDPAAVRILNNPVGGSHTLYAEVGANWHLHRFTLTGDDAAAFQTENPWNQRGGDQPYYLKDCHLSSVNLEGGFDFATGKGPSNKWGALTYGLGASLWDDGRHGFSWTDSVVGGIREEHFLYNHTLLGDVLFQGLHVRHCGRTAFQFAARIAEHGPPSVGTVTIRRCRIEDVCLGDGGSAITTKGRWRGKLHVVESLVELGGHELAPEFRGHITGCLVAHAPEEGDPTDEVVLEGSKFLVGKKYGGEGSFARPNVAVDGVRNFVLKGCEIVMGPNAHNRPALVIGHDVAKVTVDASNRIEGGIELRGEKLESVDALRARVAELGLAP